MKKLSLTLTLIFLSLMSFSQTKDSKGHTLVSLWKAYEKAEAADKPQDQLKALEAIKAEAVSRHLAWDFYCAVQEAVSVRSSINWKDREKARQQMEKDIDEFGESVVVYYHRRHLWSGEQTEKFVADHKEDLAAHFNPEFYSRDSYLARPLYSEALLPLVKNDYEYALWSQYLYSGRGPLKSYYDGRYPFGAFIEFTDADRLLDRDSYSVFGRYAESYKGKAVSMMARQRHLQYEFRLMERESSTPSSDFKALRDKCSAFEKDRKAFTGSEKAIADCCTGVESLISELDSKSIECSISGNEAAFVLRNISDFQYIIKDKKDLAAHQASVADKARSYYKKDTVKVTLPDIDDGSYLLEAKSGDCNEIVRYEKHTLSVSLRADNIGYGAYVADFKTGKPLEKCDFLLYDADGLELMHVDDVALDCYTLLPEPIRNRIEKKKREYKLVARVVEGGRKRLSEEVYLNSLVTGKVREVVDYDYSHAVILTDRTAFTPDETVQFKAILYSGTYTYKLAPEGGEVQVLLFDAKNNEIDSKTLKTNEYGSVWGSFPLPKGERGGYYTIKVKSKGGTLASRRIRVDEFVLPTFELKWDEDDNLYLTGDKVRVSGKVQSLSGHSLGSARAFYSVSGVVKTAERKELKIRPDGTFELEFPTENLYNSYYTVSVKVVDASGETLDFQTSRLVYRDLPLSMLVRNFVKGSYELIPGASNASSGDWIVRDDDALVDFQTGGYTREGLAIRYDLIYAGKVIASGKAASQQVLPISLKGSPSGLYEVRAVVTAVDAEGEQRKTSASINFVKAADDDTALDLPVNCFFKELGGSDIALQVGATNGPVWAVVELSGSGNQVLEHQIVYLDGVRAKDGSLKTVSYSRKSEYPESLSLMVMFFRDGRSYSYTRRIALPQIVRRLPLKFERFVDSAAPGEECKFLIRSEAGVECAVAVFDKATESIEHNTWSLVMPARKPEPRISYSNVCGFSGSRYYFNYAEDAMALGGAMPEMAVMRSKAAARVESNDIGAVEMAEESASPEVHVRDNFNATMAWEPNLRSDADGLIEFNCKGGDKLSTFYVQVFAHGEGMTNAVLRGEMKVSLPVKVAVVQPQFLYAGDAYTCLATLSNNLENSVSGKVAIRFYDGPDHKSSKLLGTKSAHVTIPSGGSLPFEACIDVPSGISEMGVLVNFVSDEPDSVSDAMFVKIPLETPLQTLTEAHSALLKAGADRDALIAMLRSEFVNVDASSLTPQERSIIDMIRAAIPDSIEPKGRDVLSLTEAYYSNVIARRLGAQGLPDALLGEILEKIAACQNAGGGISWFEGMQSSPVVTASVLQRIYSLDDEAAGKIDVAAAVKYLDAEYFSSEGKPWWCGSISLPFYLQTRALFPQVPFEAPSGKVYRQFKKDVKAYLVPAKARGLNAQILAKARRLRTLQSLVLLPGGKTLAKAWGINVRKCLVRSLDADVESLLQYAVEHRSGGYYYPNAVMPWRGLMESELYAHSLLCDLLTATAQNSSKASYASEALKVAEGIRLWIMVQKETQQWEKDAAYIEAIASVLRGTPETLATKVVLLSSTFTKPFPEVKAAGNGFTVQRVFLREGKPLEDGEILNVGDRISAEYRIWNEENRSFVRLSVPRPASFRPVQQLSGSYGWWLRPLSYGGWNFTPQGYRNVLADKTEYWFDSYPEENTTIREDFYVTQAGRFQTPAVEIESLYAPHYRANDDGRGAIESR